MNLKVKQRNRTGDQEVAYRCTSIFMKLFLLLLWSRLRDDTLFQMVVLGTADLTLRFPDSNHPKEFECLPIRRNISGWGGGDRCH